MPALWQNQGGNCSRHLRWPIFVKVCLPSGKLEYLSYLVNSPLRGIGCLLSEIRPRDAPVAIAVCDGAGGAHILGADDPAAAITIRRGRGAARDGGARCHADLTLSVARRLCPGGRLLRGAENFSAAVAMRCAGSTAGLRGARSGDDAPVGIARGHRAGGRRAGVLDDPSFAIGLGHGRLRRRLRHRGDIQIDVSLGSCRLRISRKSSGAHEPDEESNFHNTQERLRVGCALEAMRDTVAMEQRFASTRGKLLLGAERFLPTLCHGS